MEKPLSSAAASNGRARACRRHFRLLLQLLDDVARRFDDLLAIALPGLRDLRQDRAEARMAVAVVGRKVGAAEERLQSGVSQTDIGQPPLPVVACTKVM